MSKINININRDDATLNDFLFCWSEFNSRPNKVVLYNTYSTKEFNKILSSYTSDRNVMTEIIPDGDDYLINDKILVKISEELYISYVQIDRKSDKSIVNEICFIYKSDKDSKKIQEITDKLDSCLIDFCEEQNNRINTLSIGPNGLEMDPAHLMDTDLNNIEMFYNNRTFKDVKKLIKSIKKSKKGLSVLYGDRGTGKTSMINYLSTSIDRMIIFIPNNMIDLTINNPEFKRFLRRYPSPIIIIDDCEMMFNESYTKSNALVNNLIQLVDGFLSDSIEAHIITIFNVDSDDSIDHSLLDCNNLVGVVEFNNLTGEESTDLSKYLDKSKKYKSDTRLIDIVKNRQEKDIIEIGL